ncbi:MAG: protein-ADP-ribose hydrolase [Clostridiales bacterium]|nr:protein-ADP-ribose hydrolase [Clostridiales bacterium]
MTKLEKLIKLNQLLLDDMPGYQVQAKKFTLTEEAQWRLFRSLVNVREPRPISEEFIKLQNAFLQEEIKNKGITDSSNLTPVRDKIYLWQGDITTLQTDAIVNAANSGMTGCYRPLHGCIDNAIHTFAGVQLRLECAEIMEKQDFAEPTGKAKITKAYNLPSKYVIHTVGPIVSGRLTQEACDLLAACYRSCLEQAVQEQLSSIAFCCISTGEFGFPNRRAAEIAVETVTDYLKETGSSIKVVFNVFKEEDYCIYQKLFN